MSIKFPPSIEAGNELIKVARSSCCSGSSDGLRQAAQRKSNVAAPQRTDGTDLRDVQN